MACSPDSGGQFPSIKMDGLKEDPHWIHLKCLQRLLIPDIIMRTQVLPERNTRDQKSRLDVTLMRRSKKCQSPDLLTRGFKVPGGIGKVKLRSEKGGEGKNEDEESCERR